jgi:hypothetical protein
MNKQEEQGIYSWLSKVRQNLLAFKATYPSYSIKYNSRWCTEQKQSLYYATKSLTSAAYFKGLDPRSMKNKQANYKYTKGK